VNGQNLDKHSLRAFLPHLSFAASCLRLRVHITEGPKVKDRRTSYRRVNIQPFRHLVEVKEITVEEPPTGDL